MMGPGSVLLGPGAGNAESSKTFACWSVIPEYAALRDSFRDRCKKALPSVGQLGVASQTATAQVSGHATAVREQLPYYLLKRKIGNGSFGDVFTARQMPSGAKVAAKRFKSTAAEWKKEVNILKEISHHVSRAPEFFFSGN
jgi:hypothetical protein